MSLRDELLSQQQETVNSFIRSLEEEISQNSQQAQRLMQQSSGNLPKSIMGQVEALIAKEQQNASKLQILEEINKEATEIAEEQHRRLEEARLNLTTPLTSEVEASEAENYGGARPKVKSRAQVTTVTPDAYHQETVAKKYDSYGRARPEQQLEDRAALLRDEVFSVIPGTVNTQRGTASKNRRRNGSDYCEDEVFQLPQVPDTPIAGQKVTFRSPVVRPGSVSSTPRLVPQPVSFDVSRIPDSETSGKDTDSEAEIRPRTPHTRNKRTRENASMMDASIASHSLQLAAEEFRKIREPKIQKLKGRYSANAMLVFNSWLKDIEMCVRERKLTNMEAIQLIKDYTAEGARGAVEFYLDTTATWKYHELVEHLRTSFESGETFSSLVGDFYSRIQRPRETEDQFADELQILGRKVISIRPSWKQEANEALKTQFASRLRDPYLAAMARNLLKTQGQNMNFTQFRAECISMFGSRIKAPKLKTAMNSINSSGAIKEQKTRSQKKNSGKDRKIKAQTELIEKQKREIENLKAAQATGVSPQQLVTAISQAMSCLYVGDKKMQPNKIESGNKFMGIPRPPKPSAGVDGSLDNNLTCRYCKDTGHELENCRRLKNKLARERAATQSIVTEESLNLNRH